MKYSAFLAACGAVLAASSPILQERRYVYTTTTVVEWVTVTVTEGDASEPTLFFHRPHNRPKPKTTKLPAPPASTSRVPLPPASSSSSVVIPVPEVPPTTQQLTPTPTPTPTLLSPLLLLFSLFLFLLLFSLLSLMNVSLSHFFFSSFLSPAFLSSFLSPAFLSSFLASSFLSPPLASSFLALGNFYHISSCCNDFLQLGILQRSWTQHF